MAGRWFTLRKFFIPPQFVEEDGEIVSIRQTFYKENKNTSRIAKVSVNSTPVSLCRVLSKKYSPDHTIVECLLEYKLERCLEDHEKVLPICKAARERQGTIKLYYRVNSMKYEYFTDTDTFFPSCMTTMETEDRLKFNPKQVAKCLDYRKLVQEPNGVPYIYDHICLKIVDDGAKKWKSQRFVLKSGVVYVDNDGHVPHTHPTDITHMHEFVKVSDYDFYTFTKLKTRGQPELRFCLKPVTSTNDAESKTANLHFKCQTTARKICWMTAWRISKHSQDLIQNYETYKEKVPYEKNLVSTWSDRSLLALNHGQYVDRDPQRCPEIAQTGGPIEPHLYIRWFHAGLTDRRHAEGLLRRNNLIEGSCIVRNTKDHRSSFVLSYVHNKKIHHVRVYKVNEKRQQTYGRNRYYLLGKSNYIFYDLVGLVEFFQLNPDNGLETAITHFVARDGTLLHTTGEVVDSRTNRDPARPGPSFAM